MKVAVRYFTRSGNTKKLALAIAEAVGAEAKEEFHCRGSFAVMHRGRPNEEDLQNAAEFAEKIIKNSL